MKALFRKYRGWLIAFVAAVALALTLSPRQRRSVSTARMQGFVEKGEVASLTIIEEKGKYLAQIALKPGSLKKYERLGASIHPVSGGPHFVSTLGYSKSELAEWRSELTTKYRIRISYEKRE